MFDIWDVYLVFGRVYLENEAVHLVFGIIDLILVIVYMLSTQGITKCSSAVTKHSNENHIQQNHFVHMFSFRVRFVEKYG